jgi:hypothetical protein
VRGIERFVRGRFVVGGKRKFHNLGPARLPQVQKDLRIEDRALVVAFLAKYAEIHAPHANHRGVTEQSDEERSSLPLELDFTAVGPHKLRDRKEQKNGNVPPPEAAQWIMPRISMG